MFIEYDLKITDDLRQQGIINAEKIINLTVHKYPDSNEKFIRIFWDTCLPTTLFESSNEEIFQKVYEAFNRALMGDRSSKGEIEEVGYVRVLFRNPYWGLDQSVLPASTPINL